MTVPDHIPQQEPPDWYGWLEWTVHLFGAVVLVVFYLVLFYSAVTAWVTPHTADDAERVVERMRK